MSRWPSGGGGSVEIFPASYLLPKNIKPVRYELLFQPNLEDFTFKGHEFFYFTALEPTHQVTLHAADLVFQEAIMWHRMIYPLRVLSLHRDEKKNTVTFELGETLMPREVGMLELRFTGELNDQLCGWYRSSYTLPNGEKRVMATSQCEAIYARCWFPCVDEPSAKAVFQISVDIPEGLTAISNMHEVEELEVARIPVPQGKKRITFAPTPPMSTYLVACMVGEFEWLEGRTKDGVLVRIATTPGKKEQGRFALQRAIADLEFYAEYFGLPYPLKKADLVAIPDFAAGAMENWGADTFRETALLIDEANSSEATKERVEEVIDHELGHQWHGDLVTMQVWDGIWLNEGFASWTELKTAERLSPHRHPENKFLAEDFLGALAADALRTSRPVHMTVDSEEEINELFDAIAYSKGASIIRMLENFIGPELFRKGLQLYMRKHAYGNTTPEDLWDALEEASKKPVRAMMDKWVHQTGYPMIRVTRRMWDGDTVLTMRQERFLYEPVIRVTRRMWDGDTVLTMRQERFLHEPDPHASELWTVPVGVTVASNPERQYTLLEEKEATLTVRASADDWVMLNAGHTGFFRVYYEPEELMKLLSPVREKVLPAADRIVLCDDVFAMARAGYYRVNRFLDFLAAYTEEDNLRVWQTVIPRLGALARIFPEKGFALALDSLTRMLLEKSVARLGWEERPDDSHDDKILRGLVLQAAGQSGEPAIVAEAQRIFRDSGGNLQSLNPNLRRAVYGIVAAADGSREAARETHATLCELYRTRSSQEEQNRILASLTEFKSEELLSSTLEFMLSGAVRSQDVYVALRGMAANPAGCELVWHFMKAHWADFQKMYGKGKLLGSAIESGCRGLRRFEDAADVQAFFDANPVPDATRTIAQVLESARVNAWWYERDHRKLAAWCGIKLTA